MPAFSARDRFLDLLRRTLGDGTLTKLTLGKYRGPDASLQNLFVRPVALKAGPHFAFVWRHATRDITKNHAPPAAWDQIALLLGREFLDAHLFTATQIAQLECEPGGECRLRVKAAARGDVMPPLRVAAHDRAKSHLIPADAPWLRALGVTNDRGQPREGMADKFRQIQKFAELLSHLLAEADLAAPQFPPPKSADAVDPGGGAAAPDDSGCGEAGHPALPPAAESGPGLPATPPAAGSAARPRIHIVDMGSGKGYLTFAIAALLGERAAVRGIEARTDLVELCNRVAREHAQASHLAFRAGTIAGTPLEGCDALIALHACDTATDDALARGIAAGARLLVVAPCCQKELRPQLRAPAVLRDALQHGIFQERQAEFVTDALRAQLLEWAGYRTKVFEFISTEHTAKNLMIAAIRSRPVGAPRDSTAQSIREFAAFYGIRSQSLAAQLGFLFTAPAEAGLK